LVVIAADVDPIELVLWLPHLCKKQQVPYCIVGSKALLGQFVGKKTATCVALTEVRPEDKGSLQAIQSLCMSEYNNDQEKHTKIGNIVLGMKA
jgi:large subunit ribosomal protein L7Ae